MKELKDLRWKPMWVSHLGCIQGCLRFLGMDVSNAWLFGATGHAFVINMHEVVCPSGPTAWVTERMFGLAGNIGCEIDGVFAMKGKEGFAEKQKAAWEHVRRAIDGGVPCYGCELDIPEFYVIHGYDDVGYYFSGPLCNDGKGPKPWAEVGTTDIGCLEMYSVKAGTRADDAKTVKDALAFALEHAENPEKWIFPLYKAGLEGYENWIRALEAGKAHDHGMAYNSAVWFECRDQAAKFLKEAKERLDGTLAPLFDEAASHYDEVAKNLEKVTKAFPFPPKGNELTDGDRRARAALDLRAAREAEASGLKVLERIRDSL